MGDQASSQSQQITDFWTKAFADHIARIESFCHEVEGLEAKGIERATSGIDEVTRLAKESMAYTTDLAAAWRKLALESMRRTTEIVTKPARS